MKAPMPVISSANSIDRPSSRSASSTPCDGSQGIDCTTAPPAPTVGSAVANSPNSTAHSSVAMAAPYARRPAGKAHSRPARRKGSKT